jgi:hypothetical protein
MENQDMEKIIGMLAIIETRMDTHQARMEADNKAWREKMKVETEAIRARMKARQ